MAESFFASVEREVGPAFGGVAAERKGRRLEASLGSVRVDRSSEVPELRGTLQVVGYEAGAIFDVKETEVALGRIDAELAAMEWSDTMAKATRAFAFGVRTMLERAVGKEGVPAPWEMSPAVALTDLLSTWAKHGPPAPRPDRFPAVASPTVKIEALKKGDLAPFAEKLPEGAEPIVLGFSLDAWTLVVCMDPEEDLGRVVAFSPSGERGTFFVYEIDGSQGASAEPIDGDTVTLRGVLEWLGRALVAAKLDKRFRVGEDHGAHGLTLSQWLKFRDRERPLVDWRVQGDSVGEGHLSDGHLPALRTEEGRASADTFFFRKHPLSEVHVYDAFIRTFVDPSFVSKPAI